MHVSTDILTWIAVILTLGIFSFLWKDNPFYKFCEHLFVGVSLGYFISLTWFNAVYPDLFRPLFVQPLSEVSLGNKLLLIIPLILGLCYFCRFIPQVSWRVCFPMAFVLGWGAGVTIPAVFQTSLIRQMQGTSLTPGISDRWDVFLWAIISFVGVICSVFYLPARYDDLLRIRCWAREVASRRVIFGYAVERAASGDLLATGETALVALDRRHGLSRIPEDVRGLLHPIPDPVRL